MTSDTEICDVLVIGAGPAGLTAACYLARYRRNVVVVHDGLSRALRIPLTHNAPGFPGGVSGKDLMARMEEQAELYGAQVRQDHIDQLEPTASGFIAKGGMTYHARSVIVATGIELNQVDLPHDIHEQAIGWGCLRYCPICDGYEATNRVVGVLGSTARGAREALFLQQYSQDVTLLTAASSELTEAMRQELAEAGIRIIDVPVRDLSPTSAGMLVDLSDGGRLHFDVLYPALGCEPRSDLIRAIGLGVTDEGCVPAGGDAGLPLQGLFAAGDVVEGLDQISVAVGHGAVAATKAHNFLRELDGHTLQAAEPTARVSEAQKT